jgi:transcriptional regulator with XRE-family HTH domain
MVEARRSLFAKEIRFLRKYLDWSAEHLAAVMGVDPKTLSRWENGRQKLGPVAERLLRLVVLQRLEADARAYTERVLPEVGGPAAASPEPLRLASSRRGWREAA